MCHYSLCAVGAIHAVIPAWQQRRRGSWRHVRPQRGRCQHEHRHPALHHRCASRRHRRDTLWLGQAAQHCLLTCRRRWSVQSLRSLSKGKVHVAWISKLDAAYCTGEYSQGSIQTSLIEGCPLHLRLKLNVTLHCVQCPLRTGKPCAGEVLELDLYVECKVSREKQLVHQSTFRNQDSYITQGRWRSWTCVWSARWAPTPSTRVCHASPAQKAPLATVCFLDQPLHAGAPSSLHPAASCLRPVPQPPQFPYLRSRIQPPPQVHRRSLPPHLST